MVTVAETGEKVGYLLNQNSDEPSTTTTGEGGKQSFVDSFASSSLLSGD
jgi:hypothetical protein